jgi:homoserine dehydrogenase
VALDGVGWWDDAAAMAREAPADVVLELIGGAEGVAHDVVAAAIAGGRHVVTANKALLAETGADLMAAVDRQGGVLAYEAAVAGGIPIVKGLREGLAANRIHRVCGILNGTCNFILSEMAATGRDFATVLAEAQALGYAEADPSTDIDGLDAAHKLVLLAELAFNGAIPFSAVHVEGIRGIAALDHGYASELGYRVKLLGIADRREDAVLLRVHPALVPASHPIAAVDGVLNAVLAHGRPIGELMMVGRGAGAGPTASAVIADLLDIARGLHAPPLGMPVNRLSHLAGAPMGSRHGAYYLRLQVVDRPGVIAELAHVLGDCGIGLESFLQRGRSQSVGGAVPVVMTTYETAERSLRQALSRIAAMPAVLEPPHVIRIEPLLEAA